MRFAYKRRAQALLHLSYAVRCIEEELDLSTSPDGLGKCFVCCERKPAIQRRTWKKDQTKRAESLADCYALDVCASCRAPFELASTPPVIGEAHARA